MRTLLISAGNFPVGLGWVKAFPCCYYEGSLLSPHPRLVGLFQLDNSCESFTSVLLERRESMREITRERSRKAECVRGARNLLSSASPTFFKDWFKDHQHRGGALTSGCCLALLLLWGAVKTGVLVQVVWVRAGCMRSCP